MNDITEEIAFGNNLILVRTTPQPPEETMHLSEAAETSIHNVVKRAVYGAVSVDCTVEDAIGSGAAELQSDVRLLVRSAYKEGFKRGARAEHLASCAQPPQLSVTSGTLATCTTEALAAMARSETAEVRLAAKVRVWIGRDEETALVNVAHEMAVSASVAANGGSLLNLAYSPEDVAPLVKHVEELVTRFVNEARGANVPLEGLTRAHLAKGKLSDEAKKKLADVASDAMMNAACLDVALHLNEEDAQPLIDHVESLLAPRVVTAPVALTRNDKTKLREAFLALEHCRACPGDEDLDILMSPFYHIIDEAMKR